ncbi:unnamed protein product [Phytophthora lilii]|uniref:Unnamed protein product n=1 Tax=Phytophthora lilii TaxID=2077276 RepID=A0A9W6XCW9_9STRA|nr:unnamed protein product [Phytophthora lilii]
MVSFNKNVLLTAVAVALATVVVSGGSYEEKRALRLEVEAADVKEGEDSECGSLEMAEQENTDSSSNNNNGGGDANQGSNMYTQGNNTYDQCSNTYDQGDNTYNQGGNTFNEGDNMYNQGNSTDNTWSQGDNAWSQGEGTSGATNNWGQTNTGMKDTSQFTQSTLLANTVAKLKIRRTLTSARSGARTTWVRCRRSKYLCSSSRYLFT